MGFWESILLTTLGGVIATAAGFFASRLQERAAARIRAEQYAREDRFRLHKERIDAYAHFHVTASDALRALKFRSREPDDATLRAGLWEKRNLVFYALIPIELFGHESVGTTAWALLHFIDASCGDTTAFEQEEWNRLINNYRRSVRALVVGEADVIADNGRGQPGGPDLGG